MCIFLCISTCSTDISWVLNTCKALSWCERYRNEQNRHSPNLHRVFNSTGKKWWGPRRWLLNKSLSFDKMNPWPDLQILQPFFLNLPCRDRPCFLQTGCLYTSRTKFLWPRSCILSSIVELYPDFKASFKSHLLTKPSLPGYSFSDLWTPMDFFFNVKIPSGSFIELILWTKYFTNYHFFTTESIL